MNTEEKGRLTQGFELVIMHLNLPANQMKLPYLAQMRPKEDMKGKSKWIDFKE